MSELVEWMVGFKNEQGELETAKAWAQSVFGQSIAEKLVKRLGPPWGLYHYQTKLSPEEHRSFKCLQ
jgi:hypothetical protein